MKWLRLVVLVCLCTNLAVTGVAEAQSSEEEEARRQLEVAMSEVDQGNFEKALSAADSALRLFPSLYRAMMFKALAYEGLGKLKRAESLLTTFKELAIRSEDKAAADQALVRIVEKMGNADAAATGAAADTASSSEASADEGDKAADTSFDATATSEQGGSNGQAGKKADSKKSGKKAAAKKSGKKAAAKKSGKKAATKKASKQAAETQDESQDAGDESEQNDEVASTDGAGDKGQPATEEGSDDGTGGESSDESSEAAASADDAGEADGNEAASSSAASTGVMETMPALPSGSEDYLAWMLYEHRRDVLKVRRDMGVGLLVGGGALAGIGGGMAAGISALSRQGVAINANNQAVYAAGLGSILGGVTLIGIGVPMTLVSLVQMSQLGPAPAPASSAGIGVGPDGSLALRF